MLKKVNEAKKQPPSMRSKFFKVMTESALRAVKFDVDKQYITDEDVIQEEESGEYVTADENITRKLKNSNPKKSKVNSRMAFHHLKY